MLLLSHKYFSDNDRAFFELAHRATINRGKTWDKVTTFMYIYIYNTMDRCTHTMSQVGERQRRKLAQLHTYATNTLEPCMKVMD